MWYFPYHCFNKEAYQSLDTIGLFAEVFIVHTEFTLKDVQE